MRLRSRGKSRLARRSLPFSVMGYGENAVPAAASLSVEQLNAAGPATGPGHRTFVPVVCSISPDISLGELNGVIGPTVAT